jgi:hypothetical protein
MSASQQYVVTFIGYSAHVTDGRNICATLDFVCGSVSVHANGGHVMACNRAELAALVKNLPDDAGAPEQVFRSARKEVAGPRSVSTKDSETISLGNDQDIICIPADMHPKAFFQEITKRYFEIEGLLEQAEQIGSGIKRRPYTEHIDELAEIGVCRVEIHGYGRLLDGKLVFVPAGGSLSSSPREMSLRVQSR